MLIPASPPGPFSVDLAHQNERTMNRRYSSALISIALVPALASAQLIVNGGQSPASLVQNVLLGGGVSASNITFNGQQANSPHPQVGNFNSANANIGLASGILLATGDAALAMGPNNNSGATLGGATFYGDADLAMLAGVTVNDAAVLEFDFVPMGGEISFEFVFASEEYIEFVNAGFNDVFGFFLSGPGVSGPFSNNAKNIALVPGTTTPVSIDNVNPGSNATYYTDNGDGYTPPFSFDPQYVQYDGFTTPLTASHPVQCGQTYHIKLAVADAGDEVLDSGVFLEAGAFASPAPMFSLNDVNLPCMTATTVEVGVTGGTAPYEITWNLNGNVVGTGMSLPVTANGSTTYEVMVLDGCGGTTTGTVQVNSLLPEVEVPATLMIACGEHGSLQMVATPANGLDLSWSANGSVLSTTVEVGMTPPSAPTWYVASVSDACGMTDSDSTLVTSNVPPISITVSPDVLMPCDATGGAISVTGVNGGTGTISYLWTSNGSEMGISEQLAIGSEAAQYTATVSDECGAIATATVTVSEQGYPEITVSTTGDVAVACAGQQASATVLAINGGTGVFTQVWTDASGNTVTSADNFSAQVNGTQTYTLIATDHCGHTGTAQVTLSVEQAEPLVLNLANAMVCEGGSRELIASASGGAGNYAYTWAAFPDTDSAVTVSPAAPATYLAFVTDLCGTVASADAQVGIEHPVSTILAESIGYNEFAFTTQSLPAAEQFSWNFGDGHATASNSPEHAYADMQPTVVTVTTLTANGCPATDTIVLTPAAQLFFPNAFTPNGDGYNDAFGAASLLLNEFEMVIYDRWGAEVASVSGVGAMWDGRQKGGVLAPTGVYVYSFRAAGERLEETKGLGHVTLLGDAGAAN